MSGWTSVVFNSQDLSSLTGVLIESIDHHRRPVRLSNWQKLARAQGRKLINSEYAEKLIVMGVVVTGTSRADYETNRDNFLKYLDTQEGTLAIQQAGATRNYTVTVDDVDYPDRPAGGLARMTVKFIASNPPFGVDSSNTTDVNSSGNTTASVTKTFTATGGSVFANPTITITLASGTGLTAKYMKITNPATGKYIQITRTWVAGDVLVIDVDAKTVKVNGTEVDYIGSFPCWRPTDTQIQYDDTLTTRSVTINMVHKKRWL